MCTSCITFAAAVFHAFYEINKKKILNMLKAWFHAIVNFSQIYGCISYIVDFMKKTFVGFSISHNEALFNAGFIFLVYGKIKTFTLNSKYCRA